MKKQKTQLYITVGLVVLSFLVRLLRLDIPHEWSFDEVYHAISAEAYALNDPRGYEYWNESPKDLAWEWLHPPLGKVFMALSIKTFATPYIPESKEAPLEGSTTFAWRFPGTVFAALTVWLLIRFGTRLFNNFWIGAVTGGLYALDGLSFVQSRTGMNDIFVTFFVVLTFYRLFIFIKEYPTLGIRNLLYVGIASGLAAATKWSGFYAVGIAFLWGVVYVLKKRNVALLFKSIFLLGVIPPVIYILSYGQWWWQGHSVKQFYELHQQIWWYQTGLKATHDYQSYALTWPLLVRPVWYYVKYEDRVINGENKFYLGNIYAMGHPLIWWAGLGGIGYAGWSLILSLKKRAKKRHAELVSASQNSTPTKNKILKQVQDDHCLAFAIILIGYFGMFVPWALSPRIMFLYHYLPSVPFLCLALAYALHQLKSRSSSGDSVVKIYFAVLILAFIYFYPHWSGLPLPEKWVNTYYWLKSWK